MMRPVVSVMPRKPCVNADKWLPRRFEKIRAQPQHFSELLELSAFSSALPLDAPFLIAAEQQEQSDV
jgi:hypothetical protein